MKNDTALDDGDFAMPESEINKNERTKDKSDSDADERGEQPEFVFSEREM